VHGQVRRKPTCSPALYCVVGRRTLVHAERTPKAVASRAEPFTPLFMGSIILTIDNVAVSIVMVLQGCEQLLNLLTSRFKCIYNRLLPAERSPLGPALHHSAGSRRRS
jgi:hypothetical protein